LETELAENKQAQAQLRRDLDEAQKQLKSPEFWRPEVHPRSADPGIAGGPGRGGNKQYQRVTAALSEETRRREGAEQQAAQIGQRRTELRSN